MVKVKRVRTIDAVVVGYRPGKEPDTVGSLILGLYDDAGKLHVVGHSSGLQGGREARAGRQAGAVRDRRARPRRPEPLEEREGARVDRAAPRAGRRGHLRPRQRRPDPPRDEDPALARGQGAAGVQARADVAVTGRRRDRRRRRAGRPRGHRRARRRRPAGDPARPGARGLARRPGVLVVRRPVLRRHPRAAAGRDPATRPSSRSRTGSGSAGFDRPEDAWPRRWAEAYVEFAAGEKRQWLHDQGVRFFPTPGWAERGGYLATEHGNSVPRFHITWGTGPGADRAVRAPRARGRRPRQRDA